MHGLCMAGIFGGGDCEQLRVTNCQSLKSRLHTDVCPQVMHKAMTCPVIRMWPKFLALGSNLVRQMSAISALGPLAYSGGEFLDMIEDFATRGHLVEDLALGVHHSGVIPAEGLANLRQ